MMYPSVRLNRLESTGPSSLQQFLGHAMYTLEGLVAGSFAFQKKRTNCTLVHFPDDQLLSSKASSEMKFRSIGSQPFISCFLSLFQQLTSVLSQLA